MRLTRSHVELPLRAGEEISLPEDVAAHLLRVLRLQVGDACVLFNGDGHDYDARISALGKRDARAQIVDVRHLDNESPLRITLLQGIAREHSLNRAAKSMGMAYSKAWRIVNEAEGQLGCKLIERDGARGSTLTPAGERAIAVYEELQTDINNVIATKANALIASINAK